MAVCCVVYLATHCLPTGYGPRFLNITQCIADADVMRYFLSRRMVLVYKSTLYLLARSFNTGCSVADCSNPARCHNTTETTRARKNAYGTQVYTHALVNGTRVRKISYGNTKYKYRALYNHLRRQAWESTGLAQETWAPAPQTLWTTSGPTLVTDRLYARCLSFHNNNCTLHT